MTCEDGTVHLVGGHNTREGRVEYCYSGTWHSVCADNWGEDEAEVVCHNMGYSTQLGKVHLNILMHTLTVCGDWFQFLLCRTLVEAQVPC